MNDPDQLSTPLKITTFLLLLLTLNACATASGPSGAGTGAQATYEKTNDPLEPVNRSFFQFNQFADKIILRPLAEVYQAVFPAFSRTAVRNFLNNLDSPVILANDILQGGWKRAGTTALRFGLNSTVGVLGVMDIATDMGYERHEEDFGQTLATYGIPEGPYLFLPFLGPAPLRDLAGFGIDQFFKPSTYFYRDRPKTVPVVRAGVDAIDARARSIELLDNLEDTSVDFYATIRNLYRQRRRDEINNGVLELDDLPNIDDMDFMEDY